ncbi:D-alanyl-D-alanine carboxypeptidase family protein [Frigidibacter mobilis]|uniref:D-alanyl-D-alanine carboxypeptidase n=1 Tax=Frigidibacter mobilis TaxID=1335048 RepID=A0A165SWQ5_9RHOB|nr:D-alanyl-D-alanine carboxypeptidase family protein [Frigidibacter mobilis]AMY71969.1 D-alanyl-D-alanine carboxypeptidase [Frigidibacter mobilis]
MSVVPALAAPFAAMVIDARTGEVLYSENADTRLHPASLTKMMTLYIAFEAIERGEISLDSKVTVSRHAAAEPPSKLGLKPGQQIALRYLIRAAAIKSANDAATAIGEAISGSEDEFARRMNRTAAALGMKNSSFRNANGLTRDGHLSSARDMTILGRRLFYDFPQYYNIFSRRSADAGIAQVASTNRRFLDAYEGADGIKTGYTNAAGFNLTASAQRGNKRIIATVMGGKSTAWRNEKMAQLLDVGFGKAPNKATVQKPPAPAYAQVVDALPEDAGGAGKTLRVNGAVARSLRPKGRPGAAPVAPPAEVLMAMQSNIDAVLAEVQGSAAAAPVAEIAVAATEPELAEDQLTEAEIASLPPALRPAARPDAAAEPAAPPMQLAAADALPEVLVAEAEALSMVAEAAGTAPPPNPQVAMAEPGAATGFVLMQSTEPQPETLELATVMQPEPAVAAPPSRPGTIILMSAQTDPEFDTPAELEVVSRVSTSGGRHWAISIGNYTSRYNAERALLQMALTEPSTLDGTLRKVVSRKGGFDANFVGMSQEMAEAACRRLDARGQDCEVVGP